MNDPMTEGAKPGTVDTFEEVHVTLADGRTIYWPKGDMSRLAPAAVCSVVSRMQRLRAELKKDRYDMREIERLINDPIAFEKQFLSGDSLTVHNALKEAGKDPLIEALKVAGEALDALDHAQHWIRENGKNGASAPFRTVVAGGRAALERIRNNKH